MNLAGWILFILIALAVVASVAQDMGAGYRERARTVTIVGAIVLLLLVLAAQGPRP
jgi:Na+-driven multidrug efflux pump